MVHSEGSRGLGVAALHEAAQLPNRLRGCLLHGNERFVRATPAEVPQSRRPSWRGLSGSASFEGRSAPNLRVQLAGATFSKEASRWRTGELSRPQLTRCPLGALPVIVVGGGPEGSSGSGSQRSVRRPGSRVASVDGCSTEVEGSRAPLRPEFREAAGRPGVSSAARQIPMAGSAPNLRVQLAGATF